ncbi:bifunctional UDP-sugar hydrolase/5'-nucleotidase [Halolamina sp.]|jgi:2',3'-cyclic-nucleotide 2'-phosphodiesterase (5'-nucleotidase family)|uniref:bifunctional metallophosphatase/5'-nucleotidase n=1 Tax=Halolamina sp. TaxID=1940283 RepID=UPI000223B696|nr:5'-Nucleotidase domain-containing protein [halophilic archaeon DL31]
MVRLLHYSDIENIYDDAERAGRFAGRLAELDGDDALVVGTGDNTAPGVVSLAARGRQALDLVSVVGTTADTFGNHDFDYGPDETRALVEASENTWVSANVRDEDGGPFAAAEGAVPWTIAEADGERVGFFGLTDPATDSINPQAAPITLTDPYEAAEQAVADLRAEGVDYVVALSHLGGGDDELARRVDVDAVLGGHVHSIRTEFVGDTLCTRPGVNGHNFIEITLEGDEASTRVVDPSEGPVHEELREALQRRREAAGLTEVVATAAEPFERTEETTFGGESRIGNFVADAYRAAGDADVGLQNGGGIREGHPLHGEVTLADLVSVLPFEEPVVVVELTGEELRRALSEADGERLDFGEPHWWHAHLSGAELVWDDEANEIVEATVGGEPIDPDRRYRVATAEYLLHSDHEFPTIEERHRAGELGIQHDVLAAHARDGGLEVAVEGRIEFVRRGADQQDAPAE